MATPTTGPNERRYWQNWDNGDAAARINQYWESSEEGWRQDLASDLVAHFRASEPLLEVGSGSGLIYKTLRDYGLVTNETYRGGDISERMLDIARRRAPDTRFDKLDIFALPFEDRSQPNVICIHVLQHLPSFEAAVAELVRVAGKKLYSASWFVEEEQDQTVFTDPAKDWNDQCFYNNYYSLPRFLKFLETHWGNAIQTVELTRFGGVNFGVTISFAEHVTRTNPLIAAPSATLPGAEKKTANVRRGYLRGETASLRPIESKDLSQLVEWRNQPETWAQFFNTSPLTEDGQAEWFKNLRSDKRRQLFVVTTPEGKAVGTVGLDTIDQLNQSAEIGNILIGDSSYRGKGLAQAAVSLLVDYCFERLNLRRLYLHVFEENAAARKVYEKCGFTVEGILREAKYADGKFKNVVIMSRLRAG
ncbi:MAG: GNAT family N-acetyltransferase [Deltaproteobacteria bacterium]|nr:GNAT family N-acetyltransferase [Deltaproteobacteria bacterium]